jgi:hypothetical protein
LHRTADAILKHACPTNGALYYAALRVIQEHNTENLSEMRHDQNMLLDMYRVFGHFCLRLAADRVRKLLMRFSLEKRRDAQAGGSN